MKRGIVLKSSTLVLLTYTTTTAFNVQQFSSTHVRIPITDGNFKSSRDTEVELRTPSRPGYSTTYGQGTSKRRTVFAAQRRRSSHLLAIREERNESKGKVARGITVDVLSCDQCGESRERADITICEALDCGLPFSQCTHCRAEYEGCCSAACQVLAGRARGNTHGVTKSVRSGVEVKSSKRISFVSVEPKEDIRIEDSSSTTERAFYGTRKVTTNGKESLVESYASRHSARESSTLAEVREATQREQPRGAHMISGHLQGQLLKLLARLVRAKRVLDIGTFTGYSAIAFAEALPKDGVVVTLESGHRAAERARQHFLESPVGDKIELMEGQAIASIEKLAKKEGHRQFDVIFIDADKKRYWEYYDKVLSGSPPLLAPNGVLFADNVLFHEMVPLAEKLSSTLEDHLGSSDGPRGVTSEGDVLAANSFASSPRRLKIATSLDEFNKRVQDDNRVEALMLPLRDGLSIVRWKDGRYPGNERTT